MRSPACKQIQGTGPDDSVRVDTGLPAVLSDIGVSMEEVRSVTDLIIADEDLHHYPYAVTEEMIMQGLEKLV